MNIPQTASQDVQQAFRELIQEVETLTLRNVDLKGKRLTNAGDAIQPQDYVTKAQLERTQKALDRTSLETRVKALEAFREAVLVWFETGIFDPP